MAHPLRRVLGALVAALAVLVSALTLLAPAAGAAPAGAGPRVDDLRTDGYVEVSGTVRRADRAPLVDAWVDVYRWNGSTFAATGTSAQVAADGTYSLQVTAVGTYALEAGDLAEDTDLVTSNGTPTLPTSATGAGTFAVTETSGPVVRPEMVLPRADTVGGTVLDAAGAGLSGVVVSFLVWDPTARAWDYAESTTSGQGGAYATRRDYFTAGESVTVELSARGHATTYLGGGTDLPASPTTGTSRVVPASGSLALGATRLAATTERPVSGVVSTASGPLAGAVVEAAIWRTEPDGTSYWDYLDDVETDASGRYTLYAPAGAVVTTAYVARGHQTLYLGGSTEEPGRPTATNSRTVPASGTLTLPGVTLSPLPSVSGRVVTGSGTPVVDATVTVLQWSQDADGWYVEDVDDVSTDADGRYTVYATPGTRITLQIASVHHNLAWVPGAPGSAPTDATALTMTSASIDVGTTTLTDAPVATGRFVDASGAPVVDGFVWVYVWLPDEKAWAVDWFASTDADGRFEAALERGQRYAFALETETGTLLYGGGTELPHAPKVANSVIAPKSGTVDLGTTGDGSTQITARSTPGAPTGTRRPGSELRAAPDPAWSVSGTTVTYQWLADTIAIPGANQSTFTPQPAHNGMNVSVRYTVNRTGYRSGSAVSPTVPVAYAAPTASVLPRIHGPRAYDETLTATPGTWNVSGLTFSYQWLRNGSPIPGATGTAYRVAATDANQNLSLRVTATRRGYDTGTATSVVSKVARLRSSTALALHATTVRATQNARVKVAVSAESKVGPTGRVQIKHGTRVLATVDLTAAHRGWLGSVTLPRLAAGTYTLTATYLPTSGNIESSTSSRVTLRVDR
ncbi:Ig-like domain repeat protein [Nocardioides zeae]|uniref:Ig-like domain repeat protein n=1 Tax=Nocardioides imazamoxiresistens TaxID=3231893 RepID=A0ABU3Q1L2_9ACTN|nr:Ig-like domain repeat protein [Nocardioides zeae]MDT9595388.1 Ig-like domain repeat protein [Nocardioides zeae]